MKRLFLLSVMAIFMVGCSTTTTVVYEGNPPVVVGQKYYYSNYNYAPYMVNGQVVQPLNQRPNVYYNTMYRPVRETRRVVYVQKPQVKVVIKNKR